VVKQGPRSKLIDGLDRASSLEMSQLNTIIDHMLADSRHLVAAHLRMHLDQAVRFLDRHDQRMRSRKGVAMRDHQVTAHETDARAREVCPTPQLSPH
jgi:hypothetical protein